MFRKSVKIKSQSQLKSCERKKFVNRICMDFPQLSLDDLHQVIPRKDPVTMSKVMTHQGRAVNVFMSGTIPYFFEVNNVFFPTVFMLWRFPQMVKYMTTHAEVIDKLIGGADLMLPGVIYPQSNDAERLDEFHINDVVYVNTNSNLAAMAVGVSNVNKNDITAGNMKGKAIIVQHTVGDELCKMVPSRLPIPQIEQVNRIDVSIPTSQKNDSGFSEEMTISPEKVEPEKDILRLGEMTVSTDEASKEPTMGMDELIRYCFYKSLKSQKIETPILTNIFYKNILMPMAPKNYELRIKDTSYKKLSTFLKEMETSGFISLVDNKGAQSITEIKRDHPELRLFIDNYANQEQPTDGNVTSEIGPVKVQTEYIVNSAVLPLFSKCGYKKGDSLSSDEVRKCVTHYVKNLSFQAHDPNSPTIVLDPHLSDILKVKDTSVEWNVLMRGILSKMGSSFKMNTVDGNVVSKKGKFIPIEIFTATRAHNKKVTMVNNMELFGINLTEFSHECQIGVAASSTINTPPGLKSPQFQVQGNQCAFISQLLVNKYKIPKKFISGYTEADKRKPGKGK